MINRYDISSIYGQMKAVCAGITPNLYTSSRPKASDLRLNDFIVLRLPSKVKDMLAYGETQCWFALFAKDIGVVENYTRLAEMQRAIYNALPFKNDKCLIYEPVTQTGGSDGQGYHILFIQCKMTIY